MMVGDNGTTWGGLEGMCILLHPSRLINKKTVNKARRLLCEISKS